LFVADLGMLVFPFSRNIFSGLLGLENFKELHREDTAKRPGGIALRMTWKV